MHCVAQDVFCDVCLVEIVLVLPVVEVKVDVSLISGEVGPDVLDGNF